MPVGPTVARAPPFGHEQQRLVHRRTQVVLVPLRLAGPGEDERRGTDPVQRPACRRSSAGARRPRCRRRRGRSSARPPGPRCQPPAAPPARASMPFATSAQRTVAGRQGRHHALAQALGRRRPSAPWSSTATSWRAVGSDRRAAALDLVDEHLGVRRGVGRQPPDRQIGRAVAVLVGVAVLGGDAAELAVPAGQRRHERDGAEARGSRAGRACRRRRARPPADCLRTGSRPSRPRTAVASNAPPASASYARATSTTAVCSPSRVVQRGQALGRVREVGVRDDQVVDVVQARQARVVRDDARHLRGLAADGRRLHAAGRSRPRRRRRRRRRRRPSPVA